MAPLLALTAQAVHAVPPQSLDSIRAVAVQTIEAQLQTNDKSVRSFAEAGVLDPRLRLPGCSTAPEGFLPAGVSVAARTTVGVRCASPVWSVYVPVTVASEMRVLVLKTAMARNAQPGPNDVEVRQRRVPGFPTTYIADVSDLAGRHLKSAASPGAVLTEELLEQDILIKRGQRVTLLAAAGGIEVQAQGEAVSDATADGRVRVQNLGSHRIVEGRVETADRVRVNQ
jgi:flagella basal body P-ring formation protein FlgA